MTKPLSILDSGDFTQYTVTQHGITFKAGTSREFWLDAVSKLCAMYEGTELAKQRTLMLLADSLNFGQEAFGESFAQAIDDMRQHLGLTPKTIANAQSVYAKIPLSRRREGITLGHYSVLSAFEPEEQDRYLDQILSHRMTVSNLKEVVAEDHPKTARGTNRKTKADDDKTVLQKLEDCAHYLLDHQPTEKMKFHLSALHLAYRRKWQTGKRK